MTERSSDGTAFDLLEPTVGRVRHEGVPPTIALIHGLGLCRQLWVKHLPALASFRVINYDLYGHGESSPAPPETSLAVYARQLANVLDATDTERAIIIGFSIGGMINRRFAMDLPGRVDSLVVMNSPHDHGDEAQRQVEARAMQVRSDGAMATMDAALARWFTPQFLASQPAGTQRVVEWRGVVDAESYAQAAWVLANGVRELVLPMPAITHPTLVITGEQDTGSTPAMARSIASEIPGSETVIVPRFQHLGLLEDPAAFTNPILDFVERTRTRG